MSREEHIRSESLREIHRARDEWEANLLAGYLRDNGVETTLHAKVPRSEAATHAGFAEMDTSCGVFALELDAERAGKLLKEFLDAATDENVLAEEAAQKLQLDRETIRRLRGELSEERQTFALLGWLAVVFLGAASALWASWPEWLRVPPPAPGMHWWGLVVLVVAAVMAGNWMRKR